ncbi:hypothetical protein B296_00039388 [Ensete ventricosum]|uniref:Uncharacterized protein n=1 Tax=Ensete ventricosum TaxID=4639 RepID=A0A426Y8G7_ENSVE|nr:hypothetical protein B296_00039388 [Ensete ventricosum]
MEIQLKRLGLGLLGTDGFAGARKTILLPREPSSPTRSLSYSRGDMEAMLRRPALLSCELEICGQLGMAVLFLVHLFLEKHLWLAFCDALAQEGGRIPTAMTTIGSYLYGNAGSNLGLPQLNAQLSSEDRARVPPPPPPHPLRLAGNGGATRFDHLTVPAPQPIHPSPFYLGGGSSRDLSDDPLLLHSRPFHGLMQLQQLHSSAATATDVFNLGILSDSSNRSIAIKPNAHPLISDRSNITASGSNEPPTLFVGNLLSNHVHPNMSSSTYDQSVKSESAPPHMSATALLQKAAQMGVTPNRGAGSSLVKGLGSSYSSGKYTSFGAGFDGTGGSSAAAQLQDVMNSLANGNHMCSSTNESELQQNQSGSGMGASDSLTRDFLGVGGMMRSMGGGMTPREHHLSGSYGEPALSGRSEDKRYG